MSLFSIETPLPIAPELIAIMSHRLASSLMFMSGVKGCSPWNASVLKSLPTCTAASTNFFVLDTTATFRPSFKASSILPNRASFDPQSMYFRCLGLPRWTTWTNEPRMVFINSCARFVQFSRSASMNRAVGVLFMISLTIFHVSHALHRLP